MVIIVYLQYIYSKCSFFRVKPERIAQCNLVYVESCCIATRVESSLDVRVRSVPGIATRLVFRVPGSAGTAGREPSMETVSWELVREMASGDFLFLCKAFWMEPGSDGRLTSWWNTLRFRMMAYTKLQLPEVADKDITEFGERPVEQLL